MLARYTTAEMTRVWSEENRFQRWLDVEIAVCRVLSRRGLISPDELRLIEQNARFDVARIQEIEKTTHHDVVAFVSSVAESLGPESRFIHYGLTSTDVVDTALALQIRDALDLIAGELESLAVVLKEQAFRHRNTPVMGRTHGVHAEVTTLGLKFTIWFDEIRRNRERLAHARSSSVCGKISGAVGTFAHLDPEVEETVCRDLGIPFAPASTQTLQRDRHAGLLTALAILGGTLEKIALEIRLLQQTELREAEEPFSKGQKGSSVMPHKRNPVKCEQICGLARVLRGNAMAGLENQALWHERDISHSSVERIILPDSTTLAHYMLRNMRRILENLLVYPENMQRNIDLMKGLPFSGQVLQALNDRGVMRDDAYVWIQRNAMRVWSEGGDFLALLLADADLRRHLGEDELRSTFSIQHQLRHVNAIYRRVFGEIEGP